MKSIMLINCNDKILKHRFSRLLKNLDRPSIFRPFRSSRSSDQRVSSERSRCMLIASRCTNRSSGG